MVLLKKALNFLIQASIFEHLYLNKEENAEEEGEYDLEDSITIKEEPI